MTGTSADERGRRPCSSVSIFLSPKHSTLCHQIKPGRMKTTLPLLAAFSLNAAFVTAVKIPMIANATVGTAGSHVDIEASWVCFLPIASATPWYYDSRSDGPYTCSKKQSDSEWSMLKAYRSGGIEGVHWKYTDDENDGDCLESWTFYAADGYNVIAIISGRTTRQNSSRRWCALPVYLPGGVEGKQWAWCQCRFFPSRPPVVAGGALVL